MLTIKRRKTVVMIVIRRGWGRLREVLLLEFRGSEILRRKSRGFFQSKQKMG